METVSQGTKVHPCACEIRNPQGSCCLGNFGAAVKRVQQALNTVAVVSITNYINHSRNQVAKERQ